ncbi:MAG TPA: diguanylate cyclase, partial [Rubrivivax sp.]|nr:diguanylate cyclase [Rubrivivax sp.]
GGGVVRFDAGLRQAEPLPQPRFPAAPVNAMAVRRDGRVWLADSASLQLRAANGTLLREVAHAAGEVWQMMEHADGSVWLTSKVGLFRLAPGAPEPQPLRGPEGQVLRQQMFMLAARPDGAVWASSVGGLFLAAGDGSSVRPVGFVEGAGLANPIVIGLLIDRSGRLWLDTAVTGLHREVGRVGDLLKLDQVSLRHGVAGHPFGANLLEDARGRIWTHMSMYDPGGDRLVALTAADGAALGTGWFGAYAATPDGRLLFGSSRGILAVDARAFEPHGAPPPLAVAGLRINGVPQMAGQLQPGLVLGSRDRFTIDLAGLDYVAGQRTRYRFKLEGFDAQWSAGNSDVRSASYGNLDPGRYRLQAQVASGEGPWSSPPLEVTVDVMPVWWQTAAARLLVLLLLATAVYGLLQWRTRQLRVRQAELELRVHERTGALQALTAELEREKAALVESTFTDPLTGLRNRRFLAQHIEADTALSRRRHVEALQEGTPPPDADIVFFVIDIDHFKSVNDVHGHTAGDAVIQQMADRLRAVFRDSDHLVRWGGEEFLVVARGTARRHARELAERLCNTVADAPFQLEGGATLHKTCTVGFAAFPLSPQQPGALSWTETVHLADTALLAAKAAGRNSWLGLRDGGTLAVAELQAAVHQGAAGWRTTGGLAIESRGGGASDESAGAGRVS